MSEKLTTPGSMEIADRLEHCAKYTGLDAVRELLQEAAQAVRKRDAVIKLLEGERAQVRPAQATQVERTDELLHPEDFNVEVVMKQTSGFDPVRTQGVRVTHKPTGISVTCDAARSQHTNRHQALEQLRTILALRPVQVPMTDEAKQRGAVYWAPEYRVAFAAGIAWCEAHHFGITAQAKKEGA